MSIASIFHILFYCLIAGFILKSLYNFILAYQKRKKQQSINSTSYGLEAIRFLAFIKIIANYLMISFFPQYFMQITRLSGLPAIAASVAYVAYQVAFVLMIIPGGFLSEVKNLKKIIIITTFLEAFAILSFAFIQSYWELIIVQMLFGILIPISSSAEYAYIFNFSSEKNRGKAIALYSNTIKAAMIVSIAIGGFLAVHIGFRNVFIIGFIVNLVAVLYAFIFVPNIDVAVINLPRQIIGSNSLLWIIRRLGVFFRDMDFLKVSILVGFFLGFLSEGIVLFGLPLILSYHHFAPDIIGQILILFSIGFFVTNKRISIKSDRGQGEKRFLFIGLFGMAIIFFVMSQMTLSIKSSFYLQNANVIFLMFGLVILGAFRGCLFSPAISYISKSNLARSYGRNVSVAFYNVFFTLGKILGPILFAQLLIIYNYSPKVFYFVGVLFLIAAILFQLPLGSVRTSVPKT